MLAIDTNIVVRLLTGDDLEQTQRARALIETAEIYVTTTVVLETAWVLRGAYGKSASQIVAALRAFAGLPTVTLEDGPRVHAALTWVASGMDIADALHLAGCADCEAFVTFDRHLLKSAKPLAGVTVQEP